jgi:predicted lipid-binding transport protein (Tim44 family)
MNAALKGGSGARRHGEPQEPPTRFVCGRKKENIPMRKILGLTAIATAVAPLLTLAAPTAASAQARQYMSNPCGVTQERHRVIGGALGGVAGALIGGKVAADNAKFEGKLVGAVAGAAVGQEVGRRTGCRAAARAGYGHQQAYAPAQCKAIAGGRYVCLQPDGRWR